MIASVAFQTLMEELLAATNSSRVTLRLDTPGQVFPIVAEALAPGIRSLVNDTSIDLRGAATFKYLERTLQPLVQDDCLAAEDAAPPELIELYGVRAQMLAPIVKDGELAGIVSVHYAPGPREWNGEDIAAITQTAGEVQAEL